MASTYGAVDGLSGGERAPAPRRRTVPSGSARFPVGCRQQVPGRGSQLPAASPQVTDPARLSFGH